MTEPMVETMNVPASALVRQLEAGLYARILRLGRGREAASHSLILLQDGLAHVHLESGDHQLAAPCLFWSKNGGARAALSHANVDGSVGARLQMSAGAAGFVAEFSEDIVTRAVGDFSDSLVLRHMVDHDQLLLDCENGSVLNNIISSLKEIQTEAVESKRGAAMLLIAHVRIILVALMRLSDAREPGFGVAGSPAFYLQRFRQLVEVNFRAHWSIGHYADQIGISHDRLHAICKRELNKTPKALLAERIAREAGRGLERSTLTIEQLSHALGFRDPAHFSHFFKRMTGVSPGRFRKLTPTSTVAEISPANFADWP